MIILNYRWIYWTEKFWKREGWRGKSGTLVKGKKEYLHQDWRRENHRILWITNYQCRNKTRWEYKKFYSLTIGKSAPEHADAERITISHVGNRNGPWWKDNKRIQEMLQFVEKITAKWGTKLPMFIWQSGKVLLSMRMHQSDLSPVSSMQENTRNSTVGRENHSEMEEKNGPRQLVRCCRSSLEQSIRRADSDVWLLVTFLQVRRKNIRFIINHHLSKKTVLLLQIQMVSCCFSSMQLSPVEKIYCIGRFCELI